MKKKIQVQALIISILVNLNISVDCVLTKCRKGYKNRATGLMSKPYIFNRNVYGTAELLVKIWAGCVVFAPD